MKKIKQKIINKFDRLFFFENWQVVLFEKKISDFIEKSDLLNYIFKSDPKFGFFQADPFVFELENRIYLFFEEMNPITKIGIIKCIIFDENKRKIAQNKVKFQNLDIHLSFPFIFSRDGEIYIIPEISKAMEISLFKAKKFPFEWEICSTIMKGEKYLDTILFEYKDIWYLFTSVSTNGTDCNLRIFSSKDLFSQKWNEIQKPFILSGNFGSRMAGNIVNIDNKLIRIGQISEKCYGDGICLYEIIDINENSYKEKFIKKIMASDFTKDGIHTISHSENFVAIDIKKHSYSIIKPFLKIARIFIKIKRILKLSCK